MKIYSLLLAGLVLFTGAAFAADNTSSAQNDEIRQRTQTVTPYDINKTKQMFTRTVHGGVQHVVAKSPEDSEQIKLIQAYLLKLSNNFSAGDFSETERAHGADMPGLARLKMAQPYDIKYEYKALPDGAQIHYSTEYPLLTQALHEWFDAQMSDHDNTVLPEHSKHHQKPSE